MAVDTYESQGQEYDEGLATSLERIDWHLTRALLWLRFCALALLVVAVEVGVRLAGG
jgi:hypothetical protein